MRHTIIALAALVVHISIAHAQEDPEICAIREAEERERLASEVDRLREDVAELRSRPAPQNVLNPRLTVFPDFTWTSTPRGRLAWDDRASLREVEIDARAAVDPYAKAVTIFSFESDAPGESQAVVEEGYVTLETLPWNLRARLGHYRAGFGQTNQTHTHDLPWTVRPRPARDFMGDEGISATGAHLSWLAPGLPVTLSADAFNGDVEGLLAGDGSSDLAWMGRAEVFQALGATQFVTLGASAIDGRNDPEGRQSTRLGGADLFWKWKPNEFRSLVFMAEVYALEKETAGPTERPEGWFAMLQAQPAQRWYTGVRYDLTDYLGGVDGARAWTAAAYVSYYTTEFLRFRVGLERTDALDARGEDVDAVFFQLTAVFGAHPVEPFWVNR